MTNEIKVYVANLAAYNEGVLKGAWFTLPIDTDEIFQKVFDAHELDEHGQPHGDYAIHDYEAPFEIGEYANLDTLNDIAELFEDLSDEQVEIMKALKEDGVIMSMEEVDALDDIIEYPNCEDMSDVAYHIIQERYAGVEEYEFFLRNFNYESYGEELESTGTYLFVGDTGIQFTR